jgi:hypothetical protein
VVTEKGEVRVVAESDPPDLKKKGFSHLTEAEPPDIANEDELMTVLDEALAKRKPFSSQAQEDIAAAYKFSLDYCQLLVNSPGSGTSWTYRCAVPPAECVSLNGQTSRCTIYVYTSELGTGHAGIDRWLRREHLLATRVADDVYNTGFTFVDFTGGIPICSDGNIAGIPLCSPNGPS